MKSPENMLEITRRFRKTPKGVLTNIYHKQIERSKNRDYPPPEYSLAEIHLRFLDDRKFIRLFSEWEKAGYPKTLKPSIDRIDHRLPYTMRNIQMMTWAENRFKETMERRVRKGAVLQIQNGQTVARYRSQREAVRLTGLSQSQMSKVLNGRGSTCGGYVWQYEVIGNIYENPELLKEGKSDAK